MAGLFKRSSTERFCRHRSPEKFWVSLGIDGEAAGGGIAFAVGGTDAGVCHFTLSGNVDLQADGINDESFQYRILEAVREFQGIEADYSIPRNRVGAWGDFEGMTG